jgi:hypothetical protein
MNTVWVRLEETRDFDGHILFIEAYLWLQLLVGLKPKTCPPRLCYRFDSIRCQGKRGRLEELDCFKIRYAFNRTMWRHIHAKAKKYCSLMSTPGILQCGSIVLELLFTTRVDLLHILASVACTKAKTQAISRLIMVRSCTIRFQRMQCLA